MTTLAGKSINTTFGDLLQISNSNSGIDGTLRNIEDGKGTSSPFQLSSTAGKWASGTFTVDGTLDMSSGTLTLAADQIPMSKIDWSGADTLTGSLEVASGASISFTTGSTLDVTAATLNLRNDQVPMSKIDWSGSDTLSGAVEFASGASLTMTSGSTLDVSAATMLFGSDQIPVDRLDWSGGDAGVNGSLSFTSGGITFTTGSSVTISGGTATGFADLQAGELADTSSGSSITISDIGGLASPSIITLGFDKVKLSGSDDLLLQLGDSGGIEATGYESGSGAAASGGASFVSSTTGFIFSRGVATEELSGSVTLVHLGSNQWACSHALTRGNACLMGGGRKTLSAAITQLRLIATGSNTLDGGQVKVYAE